MTCSSSSAIQWYSIEPITKNCIKGNDCYHLQENEKKNYWIDTGLKAST